MYLSRMNPRDYYLYLDKKTRESSPLNQYIFWHDLISQWVAYEICRYENIDKRYETIKAFFQLCLNLLRKKNFNSYVSILNGFEHQAVKRMVKTWNELEKKDWLFYHDLKTTLENIRKNNSSVGFAPPCVPDLMHQIHRMQECYDIKRNLRPMSTTLTQSLMTQSSFMLKEGSLKEMKDNTTKCNIDMTKYAKIGAIIDVLGVYAAGGNFKEHKQLHEFFKTTIQQMPLDDFNLLELSLKAEPPQ